MMSKNVTKSKRRTVSEMKYMAKHYSIVDKDAIVSMLPNEVKLIKSDYSDVMLSSFMNDLVPVAMVEINKGESVRNVYQRIYQYLIHHKGVNGYDNLKVTMINGYITLINKRLMNV